MIWKWLKMTEKDENRLIWPGPCAIDWERGSCIRVLLFGVCFLFSESARAPQNKTFWNRNWSILREVLYWRLRCVIDQDPTPDCHTRKMLKNLEWMGLGSISQNNQINKYQLLASFSKEQKAASCCVLEGNHHAKTDNPAICGHQQQAIADSPLGCGITIPPAR